MHWNATLDCVVNHDNLSNKSFLLTPESCKLCNKTLIAIHTSMQELCNLDWNDRVRLCCLCLIQIHGFSHSSVCMNCIIVWMPEFISSFDLTCCCEFFAVYIVQVLEVGSVFILVCYYSRLVYYLCNILGGGNYTNLPGQYADHRLTVPLFTNSKKTNVHILLVSLYCLDIYFPFLLGRCQFSKF